ncbi:MAG: hypothetical protein M3498_01005 [Deinococcota bacterium]|jgi:predicted transcriptional regulator|nr:hypothetical protein [Deinococcota bacterium]
MDDQPTSFRIHGDLARALEAYRNSVEWAPSKTAVIRKALEDFLAREGFYLSVQEEDVQAKR